jgi:hypothetical protein
MDATFDKIFQYLYDARFDYGYPRRFEDHPGFQFAVVALHRAIDDAEKELLSPHGVRLRSDARYFLLVNLTEMVLLPLQIRGPALEIPLFPNLEDMVRGDLDLLLSDAAQRYAERPLDPERSLDRDISGHLIVESIAANWTRLKLNDFRIWGEP